MREPAKGRHEGRTSVTVLHGSGPPGRMSSQFSALCAGKCELIGGDAEEGARKGDVPDLSVTRSDFGDGSLGLPSLPRDPPAPIPHHSPHSRPSRPRPQPARAVDETALPFPGRQLDEAPALPGRQPPPAPSNQPPRRRGPPRLPRPARGRAERVESERVFAPLVRVLALLTRRRLILFWTGGWFVVRVVHGALLVGRVDRMLRDSLASISVASATTPGGVASP